MSYSRRFNTLLIAMLFMAGNTHASQQKVCAYIASYKPGVTWQDGTSRALFATLKSQCRVRTFYMDSKQIVDPLRLHAIGQKAKLFIERVQPDILIFSDDNAVKYVLQPYFKDSDIPAVFCGVNKSGMAYGLPYKNTTGMIEKSPTNALMNVLNELKTGQKHLAYLAPKSTSNRRNLSSILRAASEYRTQVSVHHVASEKEWRKRYIELQNNSQVDFIILDDISPLTTWSHAENIKLLKAHRQKPTTTIERANIDYAMFSITKSPEEHGHWAGESVKTILKGTLPNKIPLVPNQNYHFWVNKLLIQDLSLPQNFVSHAFFLTGEDPLE